MGGAGIEETAARRRAGRDRPMRSAQGPHQLRIEMEAGGSPMIAHDVSSAIARPNPASIAEFSKSAAGLDTIRPCFVPGGVSGPAVPLNVGQCELYRMKRVVDARGELSVADFESELPFKPRRFFLVYNVPADEVRGEHAHRACQQFLVCVRGSCHALLDDGNHRCEVVLERPDVGIYMPPMIWGSQYRYSPDAVLLVFASHSYDAGDYVRSYSEFIRAQNH